MKLGTYGAYIECPCCGDGAVEMLFELNMDNNDISTLLLSDPKIVIETHTGKRGCPIEEMR